MIAGARLKDLKVIPDERGRLMEILRADEDFFIKFGQLYMTCVYPGVVKGWHYHHPLCSSATAERTRSSASPGFGATTRAREPPPPDPRRSRIRPLRTGGPASRRERNLRIIGFRKGN